MSKKHKAHPALAKIVELSPPVNGKKWAIHGLECLWWSTFPDDCGETETGLACCPFCGGPLNQVPLADFVQAAEHDPARYGPDGLGALVVAHHRSDYGTCRTMWVRYRVRVCG